MFVLSPGHGASTSPPKRRRRSFLRSPLLWSSISVIADAIAIAWAGPLGKKEIIWIAIICFLWVNSVTQRHR